MPVKRSVNAVNEKNIGKNIRKCREDKKLTQEALAEKLSVTRQAVSNWETGKTQPDVQTLDAIAGELDVSIERLIYGEENKKWYVKVTAGHTVEGGVSFGAVLAMVISYAKWHSIGWAMVHSLFNWVYVIYYVSQYGWS